MHYSADKAQEKQDLHTTYSGNKWSRRLQLVSMFCFLFKCSFIKKNVDGSFRLVFNFCNFVTGKFDWNICIKIKSHFSVSRNLFCMALTRPGEPEKMNLLEKSENLENSNKILIIWKVL